MNLGNIMLLVYIIVGGLGLWLGEGTTDLLAIGVAQEIINLVGNGIDKVVYVAGAIMIYILGKKREDLPPAPTSTFTPPTRPTDTHI